MEYLIEGHRKLIRLRTMRECKKHKKFGQNYYKPLQGKWHGHHPTLDDLDNKPVVYTRLVSYV